MPFFGKQNRKDLNVLELADEMKRVSRNCDEPIEIVVLKAIRKLNDRKRIEKRLIDILSKEEKTLKKGHISTFQIRRSDNV